MFPIRSVIVGPSRHAFAVAKRSLLRLTGGRRI